MGNNGAMLASVASTPQIKMQVVVTETLKVFKFDGANENTSDCAFTVDWGDGVIEDFTTTYLTQHTYTTNGNYTLIITGFCNVPMFRDNEMILSVEQYSNLGFLTCNYAFSGCSNLTAFNFHHTDFDTVESTANMFRGCGKLYTVVGLNRTNALSLTDISQMFYNCTILQDLDLSNWDVRNATTARFFASGCNGLRTLDISYAKFYGLTTMEAFAAYTSSLTEFDTRTTSFGSVLSNVSSMLAYSGVVNVYTNANMFTNVVDASDFCYTCRDLVQFSGPGLAFEDNADLSGFFHDCRSLILENADTWDVTNVDSMQRFFYGCTSLVYTNINNLNIGGVRDLSSFFYNCTSISGVHLGKWFPISCENASYMFYNCNGIDGIYYLQFRAGINMSNICTGVDFNTQEAHWMFRVLHQYLPAATGSLAQSTIHLTNTIRSSYSDFYTDQLEDRGWSVYTNGINDEIVSDFPPPNPYE